MGRGGEKVDLSSALGHVQAVSVSLPTAPRYTRMPHNAMAKVKGWRYAVPVTGPAAAALRQLLALLVAAAPVPFEDPTKTHLQHEVELTDASYGGWGGRLSEVGAADRPPAKPTLARGKWDTRWAAQPIAVREMHVLTTASWLCTSSFGDGASSIWWTT